MQVKTLQVADIYCSILCYFYKKVTGCKNTTCYLSPIFYCTARLIITYKRIKSKSIINTPIANPASNKKIFVI